jgi:phosphoglucosamine mutase
MRATEIAVTVMSSVALEAALPGVRVHRTPVGDRHLLAAQRAHGLPLAAEESGHVLLAEQRRDGRPYLAFPGSDGLLTALRAIVSAPGREAWSALAGRFTRLPRRLLKVPVQIRRPLESWDALARAEQDVSGWLGRPGRTFLRYSGTEPVLRILVEGSDADGVARAAEHLRAVAEAGA